MTMKYVRDVYRVPVGLHTLVKQLPGGSWAGHILVVTSCSSYVHARPREGGPVRRFHPLDLAYKTADGWWSPIDDHDGEER